MAFQTDNNTPRSRGGRGGSFVRGSNVWRRGLVVLFLSVAFARSASAYNEAVHAALTRRALPDDGVVLQPPTQADLDAFRALFYQAAATQDARFVQRFPSVGAFDAWSFKEFVMLDPAKTVHGFELTPDDLQPMKRRDLLEAASRWPDDDRRNQQRYLRDAQTHEPSHAADGSLMPYDPGTLDLGSLSGSSSQGHAHYGLIEGPLSDDPEVLKKEPRRFAIPPTAHAYGPEFAQLYTDLAALAAQSGLPGGRGSRRSSRAPRFITWKMSATRSTPSRWASTTSSRARSCSPRCAT